MCTLKESTIECAPHDSHSGQKIPLGFFDRNAKFFGGFFESRAMLALYVSGHQRALLCEVLRLRLLPILCGSFFTSSRSSYLIARLGQLIAPSGK